MHGPGRRQSLVAHETLFCAGDEGDTIYFVDSGTLEVVHQSADAAEGKSGELVVATLGIGDVVGEITAVVGGRRTATVRAGDDGAELRALDADEYTTWLQGQPDEAQRIAQLARERIDRSRVAQVLTELIGPGHPDVVEAVNQVLEWRRLEAGELLFSQGDHADAAYIVVTGRLRLTAEAEGVATLDLAIGRGDIVGELGIIEQAPRTATAQATRDTTLARLSVAAFEALTAQHPALMLQVFRKVLGRVMRPSQRPPHAGMIAVAVLSPHEDRHLVRQLGSEIDRFGSTLALDREHLRQFFNRRGVADAEAGTAAQARLDEFLGEVDVAHTWVLLETDPEMTPWTRRALRSADRIVVVTSAFPDRDEQRRIDEFGAVCASLSEPDVWLVQSNANQVARPSSNDGVVASLSPDRILQLRRSDTQSAQRIARIISGNATGLALSGGGARSLAQVGAVQALVDDGEVFDVIAGTSMGSIVGASLALVVNPADLLGQVHHVLDGSDVLDYTLPVVSLAAGDGLYTALLRKGGWLRIEDLELPFVCLSTNLTTATVVEHRRGPLAQSLRSSVSIPGVFPPVPVNGELLVDGGVLENLPIGPLVRDPAVGRIVAIDVSPPEGPRARSDYGMAVTGATALRKQMITKSVSYPALTSTVMSSMLLSSSRARSDALERDYVDRYISLNLKGVKLLDFNNVDEVVRRGFDATVEQLTN